MFVRQKIAEADSQSISKGMPPEHKKHAPSALERLAQKSCNQDASLCNTCTRLSGHEFSFHPFVPASTMVVSCSRAWERHRDIQACHCVDQTDALVKYLLILSKNWDPQNVFL